MKKLVAVFVMIIVLLAVQPALAQNEWQAELESAVAKTMSDTDLSTIEKSYGEYAGELQSVTGGRSLGDFIADLASGKLLIEYDSLLEYAGALLTEGLRDCLPFLTEILAMSLLFSLLSVLDNGAGGAYRAAQYARYIVIFGVTVTVFYTVYDTAATTIAQLCSFSETVSPVLMLLLAGVGGLSGASVLRPATAAMNGLVGSFVTSMLTPALMLLAAVVALSGMTQRFRTDGFASLLKSVVKWGIGVVFVLFIGCVSMQGLVASSYDGITVKAAKLTIDKSIPIVGGSLSDTMDMLIASGLLIKNAVGVTGILVTAAIVAGPAVGIMASSFALKLAGAVSEPLYMGEVPKFLRDMAGVLDILNALLLTTAVMFIMNIALVLSAGNVSVMLR